MFTRRQSLLASAFIVGGALPAIAQPRHPPPQKPTGRAAKKDVRAWKPGRYAARGGGHRGALGIHPGFHHRCRAVGEECRCRDAAFVDDQIDDDLPGVRSPQRRGKMKLDDELLVSERAWKMGGSKMYR